MITVTEENFAIVSLGNKMKLTFELDTDVFRDWEVEGDLEYWDEERGRYLKRYFEVKLDRLNYEDGSSKITYNILRGNNQALEAAFNEANKAGKLDPIYERIMNFL